MLYGKRMAALVLLCLVLASALLPAAASAAQPLDYNANTKFTIRYEYGGTPVSGAQFYIYKAGTLHSGGSVSLTGAFATYPLAPGSLTPAGFPEAAELLYSYALLEGRRPDAVMTTNENGTAELELAVGLYLIAPQRLSNVYGIFRSSPMLVSLPYRASAKDPWIYNVTMEPKCAYTPKNRIGSMYLSAMKQWSDGNSRSRPTSVEVNLLRDHSVVDTVVLSAANRWVYKWDNLSEEYDWRIVETPLEGYSVKSEQVYNVVMITNTANGDTPTEPTEPSEPDKPDKPDKPDHPDKPDKPDKPTSPTSPQPSSPSGGGKLPQTGLLWWPVPVLLFLGLFLVILGAAVRRGGRDEA